MNIFFICLQRLCPFFNTNNHLAHKRIERRLEQLQSSVSEISMPSLDSPEHLPSNNFMEEQGSFVFVSPNIDEETAALSNKTNLFINKCNNGRYYILNGLENAYIDECENTFIFVGPCSSTLFIRYCKNVRVRAVSQQLRIQNSQNIIVEGIVGVKPVLEGSKNITFSSLEARVYDDLHWQMERASINVFDNQIFECYDFTPKKPPNFQNKNINEEIDPNWNTLLEERELVWEGKPVCLPRRMAIKSSMLKKTFTPAYLESSKDLAIFCTALQQKQLLAALGSSANHRIYQLICQLDNNICENILKTHLKGKGQHRFLLLKILQEENSSNLGTLVKDWKMINQIILKSQ